MKFYKILLIAICAFCCIGLAINLFLCKNIVYTEIYGYDSYISDNDTGYIEQPYFNCDSSIHDQEMARVYYHKNIRRCGSYLITDYENGVCINRYYGFLKSPTIDIPEVLDGKPVVKIGGYLKKKNYGGEIYYDVVSPFSDIRDCILNIPSTVKYISNETLREYKGYINDEDEAAESPHIIMINVDKDNAYYYSEKGVLFTKDKKKLLYIKYSPENSLFENDFNYNVPDFVETFAPMDGVSADYGVLTFGKNIKEIDTYVYDCDGINVKDYEDDYNYHDYSLIVKGYKGTVAEKWAEENYLKFIPLDE